MLVWQDFLCFSVCMTSTDISFCLCDKFNFVSLSVRLILMCIFSVCMTITNLSLCLFDKQDTIWDNNNKIYPLPSPCYVSTSSPWYDSLYLLFLISLPYSLLPLISMLSIFSLNSCSPSSSCPLSSPWPPCWGCLLPPRDQFDQWWQKPSAAARGYW